tara:strand:+ start:6282 stop:6854 length:573 start_codon:yes stop_codon:yes gene_type:complete
MKQKTLVADTPQAIDQLVQDFCQANNATVHFTQTDWQTWTTIEETEDGTKSHVQHAHKVTLFYNTQNTGPQETQHTHGNTAITKLPKTMQMPFTRTKEGIRYDGIDPVAEATQQAITKAQQQGKEAGAAWPDKYKPGMLSISFKDGTRTKIFENELTERNGEHYWTDYQFIKNIWHESNPKSPKWRLHHT